MFASVRQFLAFGQVFKERLNALLHNLRHGKYFGDGRIAYMMRVIEYQHRGLPHAHIVFQLDNAPHNDDQVASAEYIDRYARSIYCLYFAEVCCCCLHLSVVVDGLTLKCLFFLQHRARKMRCI